MNFTNKKGWTLLHDKLICPEGVEYSFQDIQMIPILNQWKDEQEAKIRKEMMQYRKLIKLELL